MLVRYTAVETSPEPHFDLWIPALETGLLPLPRLISWADEQIVRLREPPRWLLELSLVTSSDGLERAREYVPEGTEREKFNRRRVYVGSLYLAYEQGRIPMDKMLLDAGRFADCHGSNDLPECEAFFLLLNQIDGGGPARPSNRPLAERVRELFTPMAEEARAALTGLPGGAAAG
jgi:hypothetical protein